MHRMTLTTYDPATGEFKEVRTGIAPDDPILNEMSFVEGAWSPLFYKVDLETGTVGEKPPEPDKVAETGSEGALAPEEVSDGKLERLERRVEAIEGTVSELAKK